MKYTLTENDIAQIERQRSLEAEDKNSNVFPIFYGDNHHIGDIVPFEVSSTLQSDRTSLYSGRAILNGNDCLYLKDIRIMGSDDTNSLGLLQST